MSTQKHVDGICLAAALFALILCAVVLYAGASGIGTANRTMGYEDRLFDTSKVHTIDIVIDDWDGFLETAQSEEYSVCSVVIDGEPISNVGIRGKGNTSLSTVASMDSDRYSFKIEFDQYDSAKSYHGLDKLSLNNIIQDNTYMKDYLCYQMMGAFSVPAPLCSYAFITVNGEDWGLYLAVEAVEEAFLQRNYGSGYGELYKPDSMDMGGGRGNGKDFDEAAFMDRHQEAEAAAENRAERPQPGGMAMPDSSGTGGGMTSPGGGRGDSAVRLQYTDDDPDSYASIFDSAKTDITEADQNRLIASLKQLSEYKDPEEVLIVDDVLRYFVVHNYVVNDDSYTGSMIHNYYLYEEDGRLSMIPWDYNLAFGAFQSGSAAAAVNADIDEILSDRPMQAWIFSDGAYSSRYAALYGEFLEQVDIQGMIDHAYGLIAPYVEKDPTAFCTDDAFQLGVETLKEFCTLRSESVGLQLAGSTEPVAVGELDLSDMGTMHMGKGGASAEMPFEAMQPPEDMQPMEGMQQSAHMQPPAGMQMPDGGEARMPAEEPDGQENNGIVLLAVSVLLLAAGLAAAFKYKR